jgi:hypothetical protein
MRAEIPAVRTIALCLIGLLLGGCRQSGPSGHEVRAGETWQVDTLTRLSQLVVAPTGKITAGSGKSLTLTVNGVESEISPGRYSGEVVLTPTRDINVEFDGMGSRLTYKYRAALLVTDGQPVPGQSVAAANTGGIAAMGHAAQLKIKSTGERFNGVVITGGARYELIAPDIDLTGNGKNDFNGVGAAIKAGGNANVRVVDAKIKAIGAVRTAIWVGDDSTTTVDHAEINVSDGTLPRDYGWSWVKPGPNPANDVMMEVPWMLGLRGNNRATLVVGSGNATYNNSHIVTQRWGAMSTDATRAAQLTLNNSHIEVIESGYGAYADGNSLVTSKGSTFDVADYGAIMSGGSVVFTDASVVNSRRFGVMSHGGNRGKLTIDKGSTFNTEKAVIQLKGSSPTILIDSAKLTSRTGLILQVMAHDDPNRKPGGMMSGDGPPGGGPPGAPAAQQFSTTDGDDDVDVTVRNMTLSGDFLDSAVATVGMRVNFAATQITGAVSTAVGEHARGPKGEELTLQTPQLYQLIGEQSEHPAQVPAGHPVEVRLDSASRWLISKTSYLTRLTLEPGATVVAPPGKSLTLKIDGIRKALQPGSYKGKVVLEVK